MPQNFNNEVNIGSGSGLVPSGNKSLPEPMLTQIYVTIWHHLNITDIQKANILETTFWNSFTFKN